ncbi:MAG: septation protein IspZ [Spirochaetes bacterium]|nr:septation protein IspZ [Spirochaetota bacterium]
MAFLLLQFLPILVFIVVDTIIENTVISIISAVVCTVIQAGITFFMTGEFDYFMLADVALIAVMGGVSLITKDERFFKVKPAVIEGLCVPFILYFMFAPARFIMSYFGRYMPPGRALVPEAIPLLKTTLLITAAYMALHILAILYTAFYSDKKTWAFVSGPGFYFLFIPIMAWVLFKRIRAGRRPKSGAPPGIDTMS